MILFKQLNTIAIMIISMAFLAGCHPGAEKIIPGKDNCAECKMSITDARFGGEIVTKKGKVYKFDDLHCLAAFLKNRREELTSIEQTLAVNYNKPEEFIPVSSAQMVVSSLLKTPMGGHAAAFKTEADAVSLMNELPGSRMADWPTLYNVLIK